MTHFVHPAAFVCGRVRLGDRASVWAGAVLRGDSDELARHLRKASAPVLLGDPGRAFLPRHGMRLIASYAVPTSRELEAASITEASVWRMVDAEAD